MKTVQGKNHEQPVTKISMFGSVTHCRKCGAPGMGVLHVSFEIVEIAPTLPWRELLRLTCARCHWFEFTETKDAGPA